MLQTLPRQTGTVLHVSHSKQKQSYATSTASLPGETQTWSLFLKKRKEYCTTFSLNNWLSRSTYIFQRMEMSRFLLQSLTSPRREGKLYNKIASTCIILFMQTYGMRKMYRHQSDVILLIHPKNGSCQVYTPCCAVLKEVCKCNRWHSESTWVSMWFVTNCSCAVRDALVVDRDMLQLLKDGLNVNTLTRHSGRVRPQTSDLKALSAGGLTMPIIFVAWPHQPFSVKVLLNSL